MSFPPSYTRNPYKRFFEEHKKSCVSIGIMVLLIGGWLFYICVSSQPSGELIQPTQDEQAKATTPDTPDKQAPVYIDVAGAVVHPGVYELEEGSRVGDAIKQAGGLREDALVSSINQARKLEDGEQIYIPSTSDQTPAPDPTQQAGGAGGTQAATGHSPSSPSGLVNINRAGIDELCSLPGIGPSMAQKIIDSRTEDGPFKTKEDLKRVRGIGEKKFKKLVDKIVV